MKNLVIFHSSFTFGDNNNNSKSHKLSKWITRIMVTINRAAVTIAQAIYLFISGIPQELFGKSSSNRLLLVCLDKATNIWARFRKRSLLSNPLR